MTGIINDPKRGSAPAPSANTASTFVHFQFLRLEPKFHTLQSNEKVVARQEFLSAVEPLQRNLPFFCVYGLSGLRADCDILLWRAAQNLEILQDTYERLGSCGLGKYLIPAYAYLTTPVLTPQPPKTKYLFVHPVARTKEWRSLSSAQRQEILAEESRLTSKHPSVKFHAFEAFDMQGHESIQVYETDAPADFMNLLREIRNTKSGTYILDGAPIFPCVHKDVRDLVDALG